MSSNTPNSSLSSEASSSKRKSETVTAEEPRTTGITMPGNQDKASSAAVATLPTAAMTAAIARPTDVPEKDRGDSLGEKTCLSNCALPYLAGDAQEHAKASQPRSWLDTKEGQAHIKICIPSCEYKILQAKRDADAKLEEDRKSGEFAETARKMH